MYVMALMDLSKQKKTRKPRKPEISPTKLRIFLTCPLMFKLIYVTKVGRYYYRPNIGDSFGASLHRAIAEFHSSGGHDAHSADQLSEKLRDAWTGVGYECAEQEREHLDLGMRLLQSYYEDSRTGAITLLTEKQLREDMGEFILTGRIDRLDERPDGTLEIIDYKSGRARVTEEEVANDLAMSVYQFLARRKYPGRRVVATIHCLRTGNTASAELSDSDAEELELMVRQVAGDMLAITEETELLPRRTPSCDCCDFSKLCERRARIEGIDWSH
jgi:putative RecB family exonuclease